MSQAWKRATLRDLVEIQRGYDLPSQDRLPGNVPVMGGGGMNGYHAVAKVKGPGVVIGRSGAKLQGHAPSNGVMIGENVRTFLDFPDEFYVTKEITREGSKTTAPYVFQFEETNYRMWQLDWERYLNRFITSPNRLDTAVYKAGQHFNFDCYYQANGAWCKYTSNCLSLPKNIDLEFRLSNLNFNYDNITWRVINRGEEAKAAGSLDFEMVEPKNKFICSQTTAYSGHHYMVCTIYYQQRVVARERIGVFVNDN